MSIDTIGDFLTIIRNGIMASKKDAIVSYSKIRYEISKILKDEGFIKDFIIINSENSLNKNIKVIFKYISGESAIHEIKRISKPGRRFYEGASQIKPVIGGLGITILTTSKGIMTDKMAKKLSVGGEVICTVW